MSVGFGSGDLQLFNPPSHTNVGRFDQVQEMRSTASVDKRTSCDVVCFRFGHIELTACYLCRPVSVKDYGRGATA